MAHGRVHQAHVVPGVALDEGHDSLAHDAVVGHRNPERQRREDEARHQTDGPEPRPVGGAAELRQVWRCHRGSIVSSATAEQAIISAYRMSTAVRWDSPDCSSRW